jgi:ribose 1,5-bisphosphokinase
LAEFEAREQAGAFAMSWRANGLAYGIPGHIDDCLASGQDVLVNGSRAYLAQARQRYPDLLALLLTVDLAVLRQRLLARGRETQMEIEARLARNGLFASAAAAQADRLHLLDNSGHLEQTLAKLLALLGVSHACA